MQVSIQEYTTALTFLNRTLSFLRDEIGGEVTLNQLVILSEVMRAEAAGSRIEMREAAIATGIDRRAASRYVGMLGAGYGRCSGAGLVAAEAAVRDRRTRLVSLTRTGAELACRIAVMLRREALSAIERIDELRAERGRVD